MSGKQFPLSQEEFDYIFSKVPRLTVEIIVTDRQNKIFLIKRAIPPCIGQWHLPGGTVSFGESLENAVKRIAKRELGITVIQSVNKGIIEYPSHYLNGLDSPVGIVFEVMNFDGDIKPNNESQDSGWFSRMPAPFHGDQDNFLLTHNFLYSR